MVTMIPVKSSAIASIGHDPETNELHVTYSGGGTYVYPDVTADHHAELMKAPSIGAHMNGIARTKKSRRL